MFLLRVSNPAPWHAEAGGGSEGPERFTPHPASPLEGRGVTKVALGFVRWCVCRAAVVGVLLGAATTCRAEDRAAWVDIFNGKDLSGWVAEGTSIRKQDDESVPVWTVVDGEIRCGGGGFGFLRLDRKVCDFVLRAEVRLPPRANSGIGIRTVPYRGTAQTRPSLAAYEIQLLDDAGKAPNAFSTGSLYRYVAPTENAQKPAGEWSSVEIACTGPRIEVRINGRTVQDVDQSQIDDLKDKPLCGYLALQNHGSGAAFRNIKLRVIKAGE